jgi:hypothetical protein
MNNGDKVKDKITGFEGTVTGRVEYITGCNQLLVQPSSKDGTEMPKSSWIDEDRCELVVAMFVDPNTLQKRNPGFGEPAPIR